MWHHDTMDYYGFLSVAEVAYILVGVVVLAVLASFAFDVVFDWPRRHRSALFFGCLLVIWVGTCFAIVLMRSW